MDGVYYLAVILVTSSILVITQADSFYSGSLVAVPGKSCREIYQLNPSTRGKSGYYAIQPDSTEVITVYCDMELECGGEKGWMRIANVDASTGSCPNGWNMIRSPVKVCRATNNIAGCYSANFTTYGVPYNRVCGMAIGYQKGTTDGFAALFHKSKSINGPYLDGVSITYDTPRKHIWSYAMGHSDKTDQLSAYPVNCPCSQFPGRSPPSFVGDHYYCESGTLENDGNGSGTFFTSDPVWDGDGCSSENSCCSNPGLPWFYRQVPLTTSKDIEARICRDENLGNEDILVGKMQLYVQ